MNALNIAFNPTTFSADLSLSSILGSREWLQTVVYTSLFTNAQDPDTGEQGHWGDLFSAQSYGSLLWKLRREKLHTPTLRKARDYARSSLLWLTDAGYVTDIDVQASVLSAHRMQLIIRLTLPSGDKTEQLEEFDLAA